MIKKIFRRERAEQPETAKDTNTKLPTTRYPALIIIMIFSGLVFQQTYEHPKYNPDMINYLSIIFSNEHEENNHVTELVREEIAEHTSEQVLKRLEASEFTGMLLSDEEALRQHMPFFESRFGYIALVQFMSHITGSLLSSMILIGAGSAALITLFTGLYMVRFGILSVSIAMLAIPYLGVIDVGRTLSPDAPAILLFLAFIFSLGRSGLLPMLLAASMISMRADYIVFATIIVLVMYSYRHINLKMAFSGLILAIVVFTCSKLFFNGYSHLKLFHYTLIKLENYPKDMAVSSNIRDYFKAYFGGFYGVVFGKYFVMYLLLIGPIISSIRRSGQDFDLHLGLAAMMMIATHFVLFPAAFDRFYVAPHILIFITLLTTSMGMRSTMRH